MPYPAPGSPTGYYDSEGRPVSIIPTPQDDGSTGSGTTDPSSDTTTGTTGTAASPVQVYGMDSLITFDRWLFDALIVVIVLLCVLIASHIVSRD